MLCRLVLFAAAAASAGAQQCLSINGFKPESWVRAGGENKGFEFPSDIKRIFPGVLDAACQPGGFPRDADFCLPQNPFAADKNPVCNRCPPQPQNYFRLPLWEKYLKIQNAMTQNDEFRAQNPHLFERTEAGQLSRELRRGFCLTCYALAKAPPQQVLGPTDVRKNSVTVTTRIACGPQDDSDGFSLPDTTLIEMWDNQIKTLADPADPCTHFPCGSTQTLFSRKQQLAQILKLKDDEIAKHIKTTKGPDGSEKAVNGHHNDLMEIPFGQAHVLQAEINLNPGLEGFTDQIKAGGYSYVDYSSGQPIRVPYEGCQAMEYGMVALSPGLVETACWLVPLFEDASTGGADATVGAWAAAVRQEEADLQRSVIEEARSKERLLRDYCVNKRPTMNRELQDGEYERGTRTCEVFFCAPRRWNRETEKAEFGACSEVMADAARYKKMAQDRQKAQQG